MKIPGLPTTLRPIAVLASGPLTTVIRCRHNAGPDVAVKAMRPGTADPHLAVTALQTEALIRSTVRHPAILPLAEAVDSPTGPLLIGPFVPDGTLESRLGTALPLATAFDIIDAIAGGVDALHAAGWVHGDLSGANILCDWSAGRWVLADFGAAQRIGAHAGSVRQIPGTTCPPELWRHEPANPATDVFALAHLVDRCLPAVRPAGVIAILRRGTATEPRQRPSSAAGLATALRRAWSLDDSARGTAQRGVAIPVAVPRGVVVPVVAPADDGASAAVRSAEVMPGVAALASRLDSLATDLTPGERLALHGLLRRAEQSAAAATAALATTTVTVLGRAEALAIFEEAGLAHTLAEATEGPSTADRLAEQCGLAVEPTRIILDLMVLLGVVTRQVAGEHSEYRLARPILPLYAGDVGRISRPIGEARRLWTDLAHWLYTGTAPVAMDGDPSGTGYRNAAAVLGAALRTDSQALATALVRDGHLATASRMVDIGAGSGVWSRALLPVVPRAELVLVDRFEVLSDLLRDVSVSARSERSEPRSANEGVSVSARSERSEPRSANEGVSAHRDPATGHAVHLVAADWRALPLTPAAFDLVILANVCHLEDGDGAAKLIGAAGALLRPGGRLIVIDAVGDPADEGALLQSMHLGIRTRRGRVHPRASYRLWCDRAGLRPVGEYVLPSGFTALVETLAADAAPPSCTVIQWSLTRT
jgi:SAM-dependent methyltransferase